jgi:hypothetical protein
MIIKNDKDIDSIVTKINDNKSDDSLLNDVYWKLPLESNRPTISDLWKVFNGRIIENRYILDNIDSSIKIPQVRNLELAYDKCTTQCTTNKIVSQYNFLLKNQAQFKKPISLFRNILEIGGGFGSAIEVYYLNNSLIENYLNIDLSESLILCADYLRRIFPEEVNIYWINHPDELNEIGKKSNNIVLIPVGVYSKHILEFNSIFNKINIDLVYNSCSLVEMTKQMVNIYFKLIDVQKCLFLCCNQRHSQNDSGFNLRAEGGPFDIPFLKNWRTIAVDNNSVESRIILDIQ